MNVFRISTTVLVATAALFLAGPLRADETRIQALRQQIDDLDGKIRQIVRDLSSASGQQAIQELNRQKKQYESQRSAAAFALYQAREADRLGRAKKAQLQADVAAFERAAADFVSEVGRFTTDARYHDSDALAQNQAARDFNSLPPAQQTQAEVDRLNRWGARVDARKASLQAWQTRLKARAVELEGWLSRLNAQGAGLR